MAKDRQSSWASGELTPDLHGQAGTAIYRSGAELLRNFLVTPQRTLINRSGSEYLATLGAQTARLVPFLFGGDEPRLVEIYGPGNVAMRAPDGSFAVTGANDTTGDTVSPSREVVLDALRRIRVAQCAGTMMLARSDLLADLQRISATQYTPPTEVPFSPPRFGASSTLSAPSTPPRANTDPALVTSDGTYTIYAAGGDATHPPREWDYAVTRVVSINTGNPHKPNQVIETLPYGAVGAVLGDRIKYSPGRVSYEVDSAGAYTAAAVPVQIAVFGDWPQRIAVSGKAGDPWEDSVSFPQLTGTVVAHRVYRGRGGVWGYLGETTTNHYLDDGADPDPSNPPPAAMNYFDRNPTFDWPVAVAFAGDRRFGAASPNYPQRIWGSAVGDWGNFDEVITPDDADALFFDLASNQHEAIRHLLAGPVLLAFTEKSTWAIAGSGNLEVLTPTAIAARRVLSVGSAHYPAPIEADNGVVFFVDAKGGHPYAMAADGNGAAQLTDLSLSAAHLFEGHAIVDWAWARDPHQTLWAVRDDGVLLSLTYTPGFGVQAWAQHEITGGLVEAVATLPTDREDLLYMVVKRGDDLMLERLATRIVADPLLACHLDCATIESADVASSTVHANGLANGTVVTAVVDGAVFPGLVVGAATSGVVTLPVAGKVRIVGLPFVSQFQSLAVEQERGKQKAVSHIRVEYAQSRGGFVGVDFDSLQELPPRYVSDNYSVPAPRADAFRLSVPSEFKESAQVVVQQSQPLPFKLLAVEWEYVLGG